MSLYSRLDRIAADVEKLNKQVTAVANAPQSQRTSVEGGSIDFNDADGNLKAIVGMQDDGGYTTNVVSGPTPPTPTNFTVEVDYGKLIVHWDGSFGDALVAPTDWARAEVYAQEGQFVTPSRELARGSMVAASGGEVTVGVLKGQWTVCMAGWSQAGIMSPMSTPVTVDVPGYGDLVQETLDEAQKLIDEAKAALEAGQADLAEKITDAEAALAGLQSTLDNLDETTLPALRNDLDAAEGRLSTAEGQITDAFGQLDAVPGQISDARQAAIDTALAEIDSVEGGLTSTIDKKITWSLDAPPAVFDGPKDATWFRVSSFGSGGQVVSQWRWNGNVWVSTILSSAVLAKIDIGAGTFGSLSGLRLEAGSITTDKVLVGAGRNIIPWGQVLAGASTAPHRNEDYYGAGVLELAPADAATGSPPHMVHRRTTSDPGVSRIIMYFLPRPQQFGALRGTDGFAVTGGKWRYSLTAYTAVQNMSVRLSVTAYNAQGGWAAAFSSAPKPVGAQKMKVELAVDLPESAAYIVLYVRSDQPGDLHIVNPELTQMVGGTLVEPGGIQTPHLAADVLEVGKLKAGAGEIAEVVSQKIAAAVGQFLELDVGQLTVTGASKLASVVAEQIAADVGEYVELSVGQLVAGEGVMDEAVIQKLFTDVVVAGIAQAQEFIGENAILTGAVTAPKITASEELWAKIAQFVKVRAEHIEADAIDGMVITGPNIRTAASGARVQMDPNGVRVFNGDDDVRTHLSPDGSTFKGEVEADTLVVNEGAEFKGNNTLAQGAKLTLAAGVTDPTAPPVVQPFWDGLEFTPVSMNASAPVGLAWDGTNYITVGSNKGDKGVASYYTGVYAMKINGTTGVASQFRCDFSAGALNEQRVSEVFGVTCIGSELFFLGRYGYAGYVWVTDLNGVFKRRFDSPSIGYSSTNPLTYRPGIGNDGTNLVIVQAGDDGPLGVNTVNKTTGAIISFVRDTSDGTKSDITGVYVGNADWGRKLVTVAKKSTGELPSFSPTSGVYDGAVTKFNAASSDSVGVVYVDGKWRTLDPSGVIHEYANSNTGDGSGDWWATYYWYTDVDDDNVIESSDYQSRMAPPARFTWPRRAMLKILGQPMPEGVEALGPALAKKTTKPTRTDFSGPSWSVDAGKPSARYTELPTNWTTFASPSATNTFPEATSSALESASGTFRVQGDGSGHWGPLTMGRNGIMSGLIVSGSASAYVDTANTSKKFTVQLPPGRFTKPPVVWVQVSTAIPNLAFAGVVKEEIRTTSFDFWFNRHNTTTTSVTWFAMDSE